MNAAEHQALAQARARIEQNLSEITTLVRDNRLAPAEFFARFLALTLESVDAMGGAVWSIEQGQGHRVAEVSFASSGYESAPQKLWIDQLLVHTVSTGKSCVVAVQEQPPAGENAPGNEAPYPFFYTPVVLDGQTRLILQVWLKHAGDPRHYADLAAFLESLAHQACLYVRGLQQGALQRENAKNRTMLCLHEEMIGELDPKVLQLAAANYLVDLLPCALAAVFRRRGRSWRLEAASNQEIVDPKALQSRALARVAEQLADSCEEGIFPDAEQTGVDLSSALSEAGYSAVAWCHLRPSKNSPPSVLLLGCWHEEPKELSSARETLRWCAGQLAKALDAATHFDSIPMKPLASASGRIVRAWNNGRRRRVLTWVVAPLVVLTAALFFPMPHKIKADATVVPARTATVVAETDGKVVEVLAAEGAEVRRGDVLARLEDADLTTQLAVSAQQLARWRVELARAQALGDEPGRKMAELSALREEENIRRLEYLRSRTELRSPMDGVVLTRNVQHRQGEAMVTGKVFCEVGSRDAYNLQIDLQQDDLGPVLGALAEGQVLPVHFILHAHARSGLWADLSSASEVSQLPEVRDAGTVFTARIPFPASSLDGDLKSGYTGKASILLGRRPWGWSLTAPFRQYWRMNWSL